MKSKLRFGENLSHEKLADIYYLLAQHMDDQKMDLLVERHGDFITNIPSNYLFLSKIEEIEKIFGNEDPQFNQGQENSISKKRKELFIEEDDVAFMMGLATRREKFAKASEIMRIMRASDNAWWIANKDAIYIEGAALKLFLDGKVFLKPAENADAHKAAIDLLNKSNKNNISFQKEREDVLMRNREKAFIDILRKGEEEKLRVVIYGNNHNFDQTIKENNNEHPDSRLGYIKLSTIKE